MFLFFAKNVISCLSRERIDCLSSGKSAKYYPASWDPVDEDDRDVRVPQWDGDILCYGGDKYIHHGTFNNQKVAVCVAQSRRSSARFQNEIESFKTIGMHPYIIKMYYNGTTKQGTHYLAIEIIEPIGYDLDRLKNQYQFAGQSVPVTLIGRIIGQLADALKHMHRLKLIHRDLKTENVLVDQKCNAKLIDMGLCAEFGACDSVCSPYMAPELCRGQPQGAEVDCWGVGVVLHQLYQHQFRLVDCSGQKLKMMAGMPSKVYAMEPKVREAMDGLLAFNKKHRWTMDTLTACKWVKKPETPHELSKEWFKPSQPSTGKGQTLTLFKTGQPMPTALAVNITLMNHPHLINKPLGELELGKKLGVTALLIRKDNGSFERVPGAQTRIQPGDWIYFGVPQRQEEFTKAVDGLESLLYTSPGNEASESSSRFRAVSSNMIQAGKLVEFTVEFDCFIFPTHIGQQVLSGLQLRSRFGINLVGIERHGQQQDEELEWFLHGNTVVQPGDIGLVMREPCADGSTRPTLTDEDLAPFMDVDLFLTDV